VKEISEPTPRQERIGHDYGNEFPKVHVESRRVTSAGAERTTRRSSNKNVDIMNMQDEVVASISCISLSLYLSSHFIFFNFKKYSLVPVCLWSACTGTHHGVICNTFLSSDFI